MVLTNLESRSNLFILYTPHSVSFVLCDIPVYYIELWWLHSDILNILTSKDIYLVAHDIRH